MRCAAGSEWRSDVFVSFVPPGNALIGVAAHFLGEMAFEYAVAPRKNGNDGSR
jgi:hypothetical protein